MLSFKFNIHERLLLKTPEKLPLVQPSVKTLKSIPAKIIKSHRENPSEQVIACLTVCCSLLLSNLFFFFLLVHFALHSSPTIFSHHHTYILTSINLHGLLKDRWQQTMKRGSSWQCGKHV